jgi:AcrR family transcriptional regulator
MTDPLTVPRSSATREIPGRQRARKGEGELLRDEILDATEGLLEELGAKEAVTMRAVAQRVGVSVPSIYIHFADKNVLFYECCRRNLVELATRLEAAAAGSGTVVERMRRCGEAYLRFGLGQPGQYMTLFGTDIPDTVDPDVAADDPGRRCLGVVVGLIEEGVANRELRADLHPLATAVAVWAAAHGAVNLLLTKRLQTDSLVEMPSEEEVIAAVVELSINGMTV